MENLLQSDIYVPSYSPFSWGKEKMIQALLKMKMEDSFSFSVYLGESEKEDLEKAIISFEYIGVIADGRKYNGGYEFKVVIDHSHIKEEKKSSASSHKTLRHTVIVTPRVNYSKETHISIELDVNIFDGESIYE